MLAPLSFLKFKNSHLLLTLQMLAVATLDWTTAQSREWSLCLPSGRQEPRDLSCCHCFPGLILEGKGGRSQELLLGIKSGCSYVSTLLTPKHRCLLNTCSSKNFLQRLAKQMYITSYFKTKTDDQFRNRQENRRRFTKTWVSYKNVKTCSTLRKSGTCKLKFNETLLQIYQSMTMTTFRKPSFGK